MNNQDFKFQEPRSIPVILLLDTSGSMNVSGNIGILNEAVHQMLADFSSQDDSNVAINVAIYSFGPDAKQVLPLMSASEAKDVYRDMSASGGTPLDGVLKLAKNQLIEDKEKLTSRSYRPTVVLVSDGMPNPGWEAALSDFKGTGRSSKCYRMALGIGFKAGDPSYKMLNEFVSDPEYLFTAAEASKIRSFFKFVTMSTIFRTSSQNPNMQPAPQAIVTNGDDDDDDIF